MRSLTVTRLGVHVQRYREFAAATDGFTHHLEVQRIVRVDVEHRDRI
jgi:hypothetical protein